MLKYCDVLNFKNPLAFIILNLTFPSIIPIMRYLLTIFSFCFFLNGFTQEPQLKFWLEFEDAKKERDTVWIIVDSAAQSGFSDTALGEVLVAKDSGVFQLYFQINQNEDRLHKTWAENSNDLDWGEDIDAFLPSSPIVVRWDSNLMAQNTLPGNFLSISLYNSYFFLQGWPNGYELFRNPLYPSKDSLILDSFNQGGSEGGHFPLEINITTQKPNHIGINNLIEGRVRLYPNPTIGDIYIEPHAIVDRVEIHDIHGTLVGSYAVSPRKKISLTQLPSGVYTILSYDQFKIISRNKIILE